MFYIRSRRGIQLKIHMKIFFPSILIFILGLIVVYFVYETNGPLQPVVENASKKEVISKSSNTDVQYASSLSPKSILDGKDKGYSEAANGEQKVAGSRTALQPSYGESKLSATDKIIQATRVDPSEGVAMLQPLLRGSDFQIRKASVEALKQISTPSASDLLRKTAQSPTLHPTEKQAMLEAASFIDLPPVDIEKLKQYTRSKKTDHK